MGDIDYDTLYGNTQEYFQACGCQDVDSGKLLQVWAEANTREVLSILVQEIKVLRWLGIIQQQRTPIRDQPPNSVQTYPKPGGKTVRVFGPDGRAVRDIDYGSQAHSGYAREVHDWEWSSGHPVRSDPGRAPVEGDIPE